MALLRSPRAHPCAALALLLLTALAACTGGTPRRAAPGGAAMAGPLAGYAGGGLAFEGNDLPFDQLLARCRATGKPAMLYFTTSWCGYCRKLERETLSDPAVGQHMSGYVNVHYDGESAVGQPLAKRFGVRGFPTLVRVDASGASTGSWEGFDVPRDFMRRIPAR